MTRWFSSDLHLGDPRMAKRRYCGDDVAKHDNWLASRWDATIDDEDEVWLLGDVVQGMNMDNFAVWLMTRPGIKHLVMGNWDVAAEPDARRWQTAGFSSVYHSTVLPLADGTLAYLSHYATGVEDGEVMLHGHTHKRAKITRPGVVHVGWDAWRRYVPEQDVVDALLASWMVTP